VRDTSWPTVVVPVFNATQAVSACLSALRTTLPENVSVLLIDDASTDPAVAAQLQAFADSQPACSVITNSSNKGFVTTANIGFDRTDGDVVLLNSDTLPAPGWLQAMTTCLRSDPSIATVTPWTNNGEIASIPDFCAVNPIPPRLDEVGRLIAQSKHPAYPEIPTAVGFCMLVSRAALIRIGGFDTRTFGLGYGEENDFSLRAAAIGMKNVLCDNAYVAHQGNQSFGPLQLRAGEDAMKRLLGKHADYLDRVSTFISEDPLLQHRISVLDQLRENGIILQGSDQVTQEIHID